MSETSENLPPKNRLTESVLLAVIPALGFAVVYIYEVTFCGEFSVPSFFVRPDIFSVLGISTFILALTVFFIPLVDALIKSTVALKGWQKLFGNSQAPHWISAIVVKYWKVASWMTVGVIFIEGALWTLIIIFVGVLFSDILRAFNGTKDQHEALKQFESSMSFGSSHNPFTSVENWFGRSAGLLVATTVLGVVLAFELGQRHARGTAEFWMPSSHTNAVLVRNYGDKYICVELDWATRKPTKNVIIITSTDDKFTQFTATNLGRILLSTQQPPATASVPQVSASTSSPPTVKGTNQP